MGAREAAPGCAAPPGGADDPEGVEDLLQVPAEAGGDLCRAPVMSLMVYFEALAGEHLVPGIIVTIQTFGDRLSFHPHLQLLATEGGRGRDFGLV